MDTPSGVGVATLRNPPQALSSYVCHSFLKVTPDYSVASTEAHWKGLRTLQRGHHVLPIHWPLQGAYGRVEAAL